MKVQIDLKSALCGLVMGIFVMLVIGAGSTARENENGRYQVATEGNVALVIDTWTGKAWGKCWSSVAEFQSDPYFFEIKVMEQKTAETK